MKTKIFTILFSVSFLFIGNVNAQTLTVTHTATGDMSNEITTALAGRSITDFDTIKVTGTAEMTNADCRVISDNYLRTATKLDTLHVLDLSDVSFLDNEITTANPGAFENMNVRYVFLPDNLEKIGDRAFIRAVALINVTIPDKVTAIGQYAFQECAELTLSTLPADLISIGQAAFRSCPEITISFLPAGLTGTFGTRTFQGCAKITISEIPQGITSLAGYVFSGCSLITSMTFSENFTEMGNQAFYNCPALTKLIFKNSIPPKVTASGTNFTFGGTTETTSIDVCVPTNAKTAYDIVPWSTMKSITEIKTTEIKHVETGKIQIYPNPAKNEINIAGNINNNIALYDITGKLIAELDVNAIKTIDVSALSQGLYFIKIDNEVIKIMKK